MTTSALRSPTLRWSVIGVAVAAALVATAIGLGGSLFVNLVAAGLASGGVIALSGLGLVLTYKATGVFNFAHGAMATLVAYVFWQLQRTWGLPLIVAAPLALFVAGPALGLLLERLVFRPLEQQDASTAEKLVATLGGFVLLLGLITVVWGNEAQSNPGSLFTDSPICVVGDCQGSGFGIVLGAEQVGIIAIVAAASLALWWLFARTHLGTEIRAVVDRRELAELSVVNANRVSAIAWGMGSGLAGLTGVLLAPTLPSLRPFDLTLLVLETFVVAAVARLTSLPRALAAGLGLGVLQSLLTRFQFSFIAGWLGFGDSVKTSVDGLFSPAISNPLVLIFLIALLVQPNIGEGDSGDAGAFVARASQIGASVSRRARRLLNAMIVVIALALPFVFQGDLATTRQLHRMIGLAIIFLSIVAITGFSGHINLAPAAFAGFGAFITARGVNGVLFGLPALPAPVAMLIGGLACVPIGIATGYPALKRRGLVLGLTTLALGMVIERFVLQNYYFISGPSSTTLGDPSLFGLDLSGPIVFYLYELVVLGLIVLLVWNLRRGEMGRILGAMRDSEAGARSVGLDLRRHKLFVFALSAFTAGIGGSLISQAAGTFDPFNFITFNSLIWFAVVVVAGVATIHGALLGAFLFIGLDAFLGTSGASTFVIGIAALALGRLPGGLVGLIKRAATASFAPRALDAANAGHGPRPVPAGPLRPTARAREMVATARGARERTPVLAGQQEGAS